jgi:hypothetical protein
MSASPEEPKVVPARDLVDHHELFGQIGLNLGDILANLRIQLDVALKQLGLDRVLEFRRDLAQKLRRTAPQGHGMAVDEIELNLDAERRTRVAHKPVRAQFGRSVVALEISITLLPQTELHQGRCVKTERMEGASKTPKSVSARPTLFDREPNDGSRQIEIRRQ